MGIGNLTFAIKKDGSLHGSGAGNYHQLGNNIASDSATLQQIGTATHWKSVVSNNFHSLAISKTGALYGWGYDGTGSFGIGVTTSELKVPTRLGTDNDWMSVATGDAFSVGVKKDGSLWVTGDNSDYKLGMQSGNLKTWTRNGTANDWKAVVSIDTNVLALKKNGTMWAWGSVSQDQLNGTPTNKIVPQQIGTDSDWGFISAGHLAIKKDGRLYAWGYNYYNQITPNHTNVVPIVTQIGLDSDWVMAHLGATHVVGLKSDGSIWTWGNNEYGQLGDGTTTRRTAPKQMGTDKDWVSVTCGPDHNIAIKKDGSLWTWGANTRGELGNGKMNVNVKVPTKISTDLTWSILLNLMVAYATIISVQDTTILANSGTLVKYRVSSTDSDVTELQATETFNGKLVSNKTVQMDQDYYVTLNTDVFDALKYGSYIDDNGTVNKLVIACENATHELIVNKQPPSNAGLKQLMNVINDVSSYVFPSFTKNLIATIKLKGGAVQEEPDIHDITASIKRDLVASKTGKITVSAGNVITIAGIPFKPRLAVVTFATNVYVISKDGSLNPIGYPNQKYVSPTAEWLENSVIITCTGIVGGEGRYYVSA